MKRILLTGARGFLGRHCLELLRDRGDEVHATSRSAPPDADGVRWHRVDLLAEGAPESLIDATRPTHLLHLAWYTEHGRFWSAPENADWEAASRRLVASFARAGERAVSAGTCAEYEWGADPCSERSTPCRPATPYGASKHRAQEFQTRHLAEAGVSSAWGRIFFPYGPGEPPAKLVPSVIHSLLRGEPALCTDGEQVRDFLYVKDVAAAFVALLDGDTVGPVNVGSGTGRPVRDVIETIGRLLDRPDLIRLGALPTREGDPAVLVADATRLRGETGWEPAYDLETGLTETIAACRDSH